MQKNGTNNWLKFVVGGVLVLSMYFLLQYLYPVNPGGCPETFIQFESKQKAISSPQQAFIELKAFLSEQPSKDSRDWSEKITSQKNEYRTIKYTKSKDGGSYQTEAWVFENQFAIDTNGNIFGRLYCQ